MEEPTSPNPIEEAKKLIEQDKLDRTKKYADELTAFLAKLKDDNCELVVSGFYQGNNNTTKLTIIAK